MAAQRVVAAFSVVVPVWNEAPQIGPRAAALMRALDGQRAEVVFACNGCTDGSAVLIRAAVGKGAQVLDLPEPGKSAAINAAEARLTAFPRFYLDADVDLGPEVLPALAQVLNEGQADLVAPRIHFDLGGASWAARAVSQVWLSLPHGAGDAFHHLIGVSAAGRACWDLLPPIIADDTFIAAAIPRARRLVVPGVGATTRPPRRFGAWVAVRARWQRGQAELARMGIATPRSPGQRKALAGLLIHPATAPKALLYLAVRLLAGPAGRWAAWRGAGWFQDR